MFSIINPWPLPVQFFSQSSTPFENQLLWKKYAEAMTIVKRLRDVHEMQKVYIKPDQTESERALEKQLRQRRDELNKVLFFVVPYSKGTSESIEQILPRLNQQKPRWMDKR